MRLATTWVVVCIVLGLAGCVKTEEEGVKGCNYETCDAFTRTCDLAPPGIAQACFEAPSGQGDWGTEACIRACETLDLGDSYQCVLDNRSVCIEALGCEDDACVNGFKDQLRDQCWPKTAAARQPSCLASCGSTYDTCVSACPTNLLEPCADCSVECTQALLDCQEACPAAT